MEGVMILYVSFCANSTKKVEKWGGELAWKISQEKFTFLRNWQQKFLRKIMFFQETFSKNLRRCVVMIIYQNLCSFVAFELKNLLYPYFCVTNKYFLK